MDMSFSKFWEIVKDGEAWRAAVHGVTKTDVTEKLNDNSNKLSILLTKIQMLLKSWRNNLKIPYSKKLIMG